MLPASPASSAKHSPRDLVGAQLRQQIEIIAARLLIVREQRDDERLAVHNGFGPCRKPRGVSAMATTRPSVSSSIFRAASCARPLSSLAPEINDALEALGDQALQPRQPTCQQIQRNRPGDRARGP